MAEILPFCGGQRIARNPSGSQRAILPLGAEILIFPGVRYERDEPSEREVDSR